MATNWRRPETYEKGLAKFSGSFALSKAYGRVLVSLRRFDEAQPVLAAAHLRNTTDGEISYYLRMAEEVAGSERAALNRYEEALRSPEHRGAAGLRLAELHARGGQTRGSAQIIWRDSLKANPEDLRDAGRECGDFRRDRPWWAKHRDRQRSCCDDFR